MTGPTTGATPGLAAPLTGPVVLEGVRVFDGSRLSAPRRVVIDGATIADPAEHRGAPVTLDAAGASLLPGLIDAHVHLTGPAELEQLAHHGVTTALDMGSWPPSTVDALRHRPGLTDVRSAGLPAAAPGGLHARMPGFPADGTVSSPEEADDFVARQLAAGADYVKVVADAPGPGSLDQPTLDALVAAAHRRGRAVVAHAAQAVAFAMAQQAGADVVTHVPIAGPPLDADAVQRMVHAGRAVVPTLVQMALLVQHVPVPGLSYDPARASVAALHEAGVPVLAGTDANAGPGMPAPAHGVSLHEELERLVDAGLEPVDALRAATSSPATTFSLTDRGAVTPRLRADLLLVDGDPTTDISATRAILGVWVAGQRVR